VYFGVPLWPEDSSFSVTGCQGNFRWVQGTCQPVRGTSTRRKLPTRLSLHFLIYYFFFFSFLFIFLFHSFHFLFHALKLFLKTATQYSQGRFLTQRKMRIPFLFKMPKTTELNKNPRWNNNKFILLFSKYSHAEFTCTKDAKRKIVDQNSQCSLGGFHSPNQNPNTSQKQVECKTMLPKHCPLIYQRW